MPMFETAFGDTCPRCGVELAYKIGRMGGEGHSVYMSYRPEDNEGYGYCRICNIIYRSFRPTHHPLQDEELVRMENYWKDVLDGKGP